MALPSLTSPPTPSPPRSISTMFPNSCGEMEQLRAILWARLALRINRPLPTEDRVRYAASLEAKDIVDIFVDRLED